MIYDTVTTLEEAKGLSGAVNSVSRRKRTLRYSKNLKRKKNVIVSDLERKLAIVDVVLKAFQTKRKGFFLIMLIDWIEM